MCLIDSKPALDDQHVCVIRLSRSGFVMEEDGRPVEVEPSPASFVAQVTEKHLTARLFPSGRRFPALCSSSRSPFSAKRSRRSSPKSRQRSTSSSNDSKGDYSLLGV